MTSSQSESDSKSGVSNMEKRKKEIIGITSIIIVFLVVISAIYVFMPLNISFSKTYTLGGLLYDIDDLGNGSYYFYMTDTSFRPWSCENCWSFPYQQGKEKFYFSDVGDCNISNFIDRDIDITYISNGTYSKITSIEFTYYDSIRETEKQKEKQITFEEWIKENYPEIFIEYSEYLKNLKVMGGSQFFTELKLCVSLGRLL